MMIDTNFYPFNLIRAIYGENEYDDTHSETTYIKGLYEQLKTLNSNEHRILYLRFAKGYTIKECAENLQLSPERARQTIHKALRDMRTSRRREHYEAVSRVQYEELQGKYETLLIEKQELQYSLNLIGASEIEPQDIIILSKMLKPHRLNAHIGELNLSTRTYNVLNRAGIQTIKDVMATSERTLNQLRNLGGKSVAELKFKMREYILLMDTNDESLLDSNPGESADGSDSI